MCSKRRDEYRLREKSSPSCTAITIEVNGREEDHPEEVSPSLPSFYSTSFEAKFLERSFQCRTLTVIVDLLVGEKGGGGGGSSPSKDRLGLLTAPRDTFCADTYQTRKTTQSCCNAGCMLRTRNAKVLACERKGGKGHSCPWFMSSVIQGGNRAIKLTQISALNQVLIEQVVFLRARTWQPVPRKPTHSCGKNRKN